MRDLIKDLFQDEPPNPVQSARRGLQSPRRARFYRDVAIGEDADGFDVLLDGRRIRTPAGRRLAAPNRALAEAIAVEWRDQQDVIDPSRMPLTRLANSIIDGVADKTSEVAEGIAKYLTCDLVCYRADGPDGLVERQTQLWDPVLAWARDALGARFILSQGVVFVAQPEAALNAARRAIPTDPWRLGAIAAVTTLTGSALLALALAQGVWSADQVWEAGNVDEDWNMQLWGRDEEALVRRAHRSREMQAAAEVLRLIA